MSKVRVILENKCVRSLR